MILPYIFTESIQFIVKTHNPTVCHRSQYGNSEFSSCLHIGRTVKSADHGGSGSPKSRIVALGTAETEFHQCIVRCDSADTPGFGGNQTFMVQNHGESCFKNHRLCRRSVETEQRFSRKSNRPFGNGINIAGEMKVCQIVQKFGIKNTETIQIGNILLGKSEIFYKVLQVGKTCHYRIAAVKRIFSVKAVKYNFPFMTVYLKKCIRHRELV